MDIHIRAFVEKDLDAVQFIWNEVIQEGESFHWTEPFDRQKIEDIIRRQDAVYCAVHETGDLTGFYILHKNASGRGSHVANALYAVRSDYRNRGIGKMLGLHSIEISKQFGYRALQFNSVVSSNTGSVRLWESLGFQRAGTLFGAFRTKTDEFVDVYIYMKVLCDWR
ncbi:GNAT family N-acetyltransferase [Paenibacillus sp. UNC451MF]|uniref:GNAT family N-acetyltransferase n=1 Tax=Paenibacillus sp. UNC451MF TaxID=1449063 RepID=UPI00048E012D|nr:N-acetyltransferase [Paenibacillus sp. UNC451MF]